MTGLKIDESKLVSAARSSSETPVKLRNFNWDRNMLESNLLRKLCEYVILDYYLFDFEPPAGCRDLVEKHIAMIEKKRL